MRRENDPVLKELGEALKRFIRSQDLAVYENEALLTDNTFEAMVET